MSMLEHRLGVFEGSLAAYQRAFASLKFAEAESLVASNNHPDEEAIAI